MRKRRTACERPLFYWAFIDGVRAFSLAASFCKSAEDLVRGVNAEWVLEPRRLALHWSVRLANIEESDSGANGEDGGTKAVGGRKSMSRWRFSGPVVALALCAAPSFASVIDFEDIPAGTVYGVPDDVAGDVIITTPDGIEVSVDELLVNNNPFFFQAVVGGEFDPFFDSTPVSMDNITFSFDFANLATAVDFVSIEFQEFGGVSNFAVNGGVPYQLTSLANLPSNVAPGVTAVVNEDMIVLLGDIDSFLIGGQELGIDNVIAVPEPLSLTILAFGAGTLALRRRAVRAAP